MTITPFARAMRNAGYLLGGNGIGAVLGFLTTVFAARQLGLQGYGILLLINSFTGALATATRLQTWQPMLQFGTALYEAEDRPRFQTLLRHCLLLDGAGALAAVMIGVPMSIVGSHYLGWGGHEKTTALYVTCALFMNTGATIGVMRITDRYRMAVIADNLSALIRFTGAIAGYCLHWNLTFFLVFWYASIVVAFLADGALLWRLTRLIPSLRGFRLTGVPWRSHQTGFWKLLLPTSADQALINVASRIDILIVGAVLGGAGATLYRVATQVSDALMQPAVFLSPALYPEFVRLREQQDWANLRKMTWRICRLLSAFSVPILLIMYFAGPAILALMLGKHISHTRELLLWMTTASIIGLWSVPLEPLLISLGRAKTVLHGRLWFLLPCLPLFYVLTRRYGVEGAAIVVFIRSTAIFMTRLVPFLTMPETRRP
ncbi:lipopolysaccharide biosynthesis protein [Acidocella sp.]|uniref:lipopolysaccharide biosynthesis protein n=1 Tax=Acidocella sp. TaxID=50710 RepID=UPI00260C443E|nr:oligosaccharide flippase family protein [Acidocella sp.]